MDDAPAGVRLRLRQAALRSAARRPCPAGARAPLRRARLPDEAGSIPREPRRASRRHDVSAWHARGGRHRHVPVAGPALLPPGPARGPTQADLAPSGARARGAARRCAARLLRPSAGGAQAARGSGGGWAPARMRAGLGRQLDLGWLHRLVVGRRGRPAAAGRGQLCREPGPVLRPSAVYRSRWPHGAPPGPDEFRALRPRRERAGLARPVSRPAALGIPHVRDDRAMSSTVGVSTLSPTGSQQAPPRDPSDFSFVLGGPLYQLIRRAHLSGDALELLRRRIVVIALFAWFPLLILSTLGGRGWGHAVKVPFAMGIEVDGRFRLSLPLLTV